jgi:hypothetical protein
MALSMDEQRMLAEIERRLAAEDPGLAARLSTFRRPSRVSLFRSARARVIGSLLCVAVVAMVSLLVYAIVPFRSGSRASGHHPVTTVSSAGTGQAKLGAGPGTNPAGGSAASSAVGAAQSPAAKAASGSTPRHSPASRVSGSGAPAAAGAAGTTAHPASTASHGP